MEANTLREKLIDLYQFLEDKLKKEGIQLKPLPTNTKKNCIFSTMCNGTFFYIALSERYGFTFHWEAHHHNYNDWFNDRCEAIKKLSASFSYSSVEHRKKSRLWITVDQSNYKESILAIIKTTRGTMGYNPQ